MPKQVLEKFFGYEDFRPHQEEAIQTILDGKDALVIMPTGGGKSMIFQIPAIMQDGMTVVISPLIALMKDQVDALKANGIPAAFVNSSMDVNTKRQVLDDIYEGRVKLLYVAPETLLKQGFLQMLQRINISFFAIDEAHCISTWGHDFRPEYAQLSKLKDLFPNLPIVALTATADRITQNDISQLLHLKEPSLFISSFDRPNLSLTVAPAQKRIQVIMEFLEERPNTSGIIYCLSKRSTEDISNKLNKKGFNSAFYHAALPPKERSQIQEDFINDKTPIICATIAFGMGIDKSNVRWVIHYNLPKNIESYYQQIGRAGRDGIPSDTLLFYTFYDISILQKFAEESGQPEIQLEKLARIRQYAEAQTCRRKILLSYFNEQLEDNCGNCDVCKNPPKRVNGTVLAQKALSGILRTKERIAQGMLIDLLRGSNRREIMEQGFNQVKTYGAGRDLSYFQWQQYLLQMLHHGLFDIDYQDHQFLKITPYGRKVLFGEKELELSYVGTFQEQKSARKPKKLVTKKESKRGKLFEKIHDLRHELAMEHDIPPHTLLSDVSLRDMAEKSPENRSSMLQVEGMTEHKYKLYGKHFELTIRQFKRNEQNREWSKAAGSTYLATKQFLDEGQTIKDVAKKRGYSIATIENHIARLFADGVDIDTSMIISDKELVELSVLINELPMPMEGNLREVFEYFSEKFTYAQLKLAKAYLDRQTKDL